MKDNYKMQAHKIKNRYPWIVNKIDRQIARGETEKKEKRIFVKIFRN